MIVKMKMNNKTRTSVSFIIIVKFSQLRSEKHRSLGNIKPIIIVIIRFLVISLSLSSSSIYSFSESCHSIKHFIYHSFYFHSNLSDVFFIFWIFQATTLSRWLRKTLETGQGDRIHYSYHFLIAFMVQVELEFENTLVKGTSILSVVNFTLIHSLI